MRLHLARALTVGIVALLVSCASGAADRPVEGRGGIDLSPASPPVDLDLGVTESVLPTPTTESAVSLPAPAADRSVVTGRLILIDPLNTAPEDDGVYLVPIEQELESEVSFAVPQINEDSYQADVDVTTGDFSFEAVPVGFYALVVRTLDGRQLSVRDLATAQTTLVMVTEDDLGSVLDLGEQRVP